MANWMSVAVGSALAISIAALSEPGDGSFFSSNGARLFDEEKIVIDLFSLTSK
jgi:hypothetical protein